METRVRNNTAKLQGVAGELITRGKIPAGRRIVVIANSHASNTSVTAAAELKKDFQNIGEIENAEGVKMDFYGDGSEHKATPFGTHIEAKINSLS